MSAKQTKKAKPKKAKVAKPKATKHPKKEASKKETVAARPEEKVAERREAARAPVPAGAPPTALVSARHDGSMIERKARGYSLGEISEAGIGRLDAKRWEVPVDMRRGSTLGRNVEMLQDWLRAGGTGRTPSIAKGGPRKKE